MIFAMSVFGTLGVFVRYIPLPSGSLAFLRGVIGVVFLLIVKAIKRSPVDFGAIKKNLLPLCLSGAFIGINWILLFQAYKLTTVSTATLCYYMSPVFITLFSPIILRERLSVKKAVCIFTAFIGMIFVSGVFSAPENMSPAGIACGLGAAFFYSAVVLTNKKLKDISDCDMTLFQLAAAAVVILPYTLLCEKVTAETITPLSVIMILTVGVIHTGFTYNLYFRAIASLPAQTSAVLGYIDPVVALILSAIFLSEPLDLFGYIGAVLILGSAFISETAIRRKPLSKSK